MNMFAKNEANSIEEYLSNIPENRQKDINSLHEFIQKTLPKFKPYFASNMIGYGFFEYLDSKKQKKTWPIISLANKKNYTSIYICSIIDGEYVAEKYANNLGKVNVWRSCIQFKKFEDINLDTLNMILKIAEENPGLSGYIAREK